MYMKPMLRTIATVLAIFLLSDCVKQEQDSESGTGFSLGQTSVEVPAEGGEVTVAYVLEDPVEGLEVIPKITVDWVHDFDMSDAGRVKFTVDPTDVEVYDRETVLTLTYGEEARDLKIVQKGAEASIEFVVEQARHYSFIVRIVPKDPDMRCFVTAVEKETADSYVLDEEIFAADAEHFREHAELYGLTLEQYFNQIPNDKLNLDINMLFLPILLEDPGDGDVPGRLGRLALLRMAGRGMDRYVTMFPGWSEEDGPMAAISSYPEPNKTIHKSYEYFTYDAFGSCYIGCKWHVFHFG